MLGTWSGQSVVQSGQLPRAGPGALLPRVQMLDRMVAAVGGVEHRRRAYGRRQSGALYEQRGGAGPPQMADVVQVGGGGRRKGQEP